MAVGICFGSNYTILHMAIPDNPSKPCLSCTKQWCLNQNLPICAGASTGKADPDTATGKEGDVEARCFRGFSVPFFPRRLLKTRVPFICNRTGFTQRSTRRNPVSTHCFWLATWCRHQESHGESRIRHQPPLECKQAVVGGKNYLLHLTTSCSLARL